MDRNTPRLAKALILASHIEIGITESTRIQRTIPRQTISSWKHQDKLLRYKQSRTVILNVEATKRTYIKHVVISFHTTGDALAYDNGNDCARK